MVAKLREYLKLTKPSIMLLVVLTGAASLVMQRALPERWGFSLLVLLGLFCTGGSANALNQYFERDLDARMGRTKKRRPLPTGTLTPRQALVFAVGIGAFGVLLLWLVANALSALLALATVLFYGLFYTLYLKPRTEQNIVIGGAAGAMAPVIAWAAAAGNLAVAPWLLFAVIFLWTPPHFWALALYLKDDYDKVKLPMMPNVRGEAATLRQILVYTGATVLCSLALVEQAGWLYFGVAALLGGVFMVRAVRAWRERSVTAEAGLFRYSIVYMLALCVAIIVTGLAGWDGG